MKEMVNYPRVADRRIWISVIRVVLGLHRELQDSPEVLTTWTVLSPLMKKVSTYCTSAYMCCVKYSYNTFFQDYCDEWTIVI